MLETRKVDNNNMCNALFASPLYVTVMRYLEECSGSGCVILSSVVNKKQIKDMSGISSPDQLLLMFDTRALWG